jgi:hypothetical protein
MRLIGLMALIGALIGGAFLLATIAAAGSSPQEAAGAAFAIAFAVVPYCLHGTLIRMRKGDD